MKQLTRRQLTKQVGSITPWAVLFGIVMLGSLLGFVAYMTLAGQLDLKQQPLEISLPSRLDATVQLPQPLPLSLSAVPIRTTIHQPLHTVLRGTYPVQTDVRLPIIIDLNLPIRQSIQVQTNLYMDTTSAIVLPHLPAVPLRLTLPLTFNLPINVTIPIKTTIPIHYAGAMSLGFNQPIDTILDTTIATTVAVQKPIGVVVPSPIAVQIQPQQQAIAIQANGTISSKLSDIGFYALR